MGFCVSFHRTWTPGYGAYIDPNRLSRFHRRLSLAKKVCAIIFAAVALSAIVLLLYLLYTRCNGNVPCIDCKPVERTMNNSSYYNVTDAPITEAFAGPLGPFMHAGRSSSDTVGKEVSFRSEEARSVNEVDSTDEETTSVKEVDVTTEETTVTTSSVKEVDRTTVETASVKELDVITEDTTSSVKEVVGTTEETTSVKDFYGITEGTTSVMEVDSAGDNGVSGIEANPPVEDTTTAIYERGESFTRNEIPLAEEKKYESETEYPDYEDDSYNDKEPTTTITYPELEPEGEFGEEMSAKTGNKRDSPGIEDIFSGTETSTVLGYEDCKEPDFQCAYSLGCLSQNQRCDGRFDCNKYPLTTTTLSSMEKLKEQGFRGDRSDELNCTCGENYFKCDETAKSECIHNSLVCDFVKDCSNGKDESTCMQLSEDLEKISKKNWSSDEGYGIEGHVLVRMKGSWHPYCSNDWSSELAEKICRWFDHKKVAKLLKIRLVDLNKKGILPAVDNTAVVDDFAVIPGISFLLVGGEKPFNPWTSGPLEEIATETYGQDGLNCTIAYLVCGKL